MDSNKNVFKVYLPNVQLHVIAYKPDMELGSILDKICEKRSIWPPSKITYHVI